MKCWIAIALLWVSTIASSQDSTSVALHRISTTRVFAFGGIGDSGTTSEGEKDFKIIMSLPAAKAIVDLERLYAIGNPQAMSYALAGIRKLDKKRFNDLFKSVRASELKVRTAMGCIFFDRSLRDVAMDLDSGKYDLRVR